jgi:superfamily I DNA and RNA helicase
VIFREIEAALAHFPYLEFEMPDLHRIDIIQRDLSEREVKKRKILDEAFAKLRAAGFSDDEIPEIVSTEVKNGAA